MKMLQFILAVAAVGVIAASAAEPVTAAKPGSPPEGPLLKRIADFTCWRISFQYLKDKEKPTPENPVDYGPGPDPSYLPSPIRHVTITRTKPRYLVVTEDVKGNRVEQCSDGVDHYIFRPRDSDIALFIKDPTIPMLLSDYGSVDFPDLEWIAPTTFTGLQTIGEQSCMVFSKDGMTAWVSLETKMPVLWKKSGETRTFQQLPRPGKMVELPPKIQQLSDTLKRDREKLSRPCPRGG